MKLQILQHIHLHETRTYGIYISILYGFWDFVMVRQALASCFLLLQVFMQDWLKLHIYV